MTDQQEQMVLLIVRPEAKAQGAVPNLTGRLESFGLQFLAGQGRLWDEATIASFLRQINLYSRTEVATLSSGSAHYLVFTAGRRNAQEIVAHLPIDIKDDALVIADQTHYDIACSVLNISVRERE